MKISIKLSITVFALLLASTMFAQIPRMGNQQNGHPGPPPIPNAEQIEEMVSQLATEISLSAEQEASILKLHIEHFDEARTKTSGEQKPPREEMEKLKSDFEQKVKALLSEEQKVKFDEFRKKHQHHNKPKPPNGKNNKQGKGQKPR